MATALGVLTLLDGFLWYVQNTFHFYRINVTWKYVEDDAKNKGRASWVDFKQVVWHASFYKLLESIKEISEIRHWVKCGDGVEHHIFPLILILAADYEEQQVTTSLPIHTQMTHWVLQLPDDQVCHGSGLWSWQPVPMSTMPSGWCRPWQLPQ